MGILGQLFGNKQTQNDEETEALLATAMKALGQGYADTAMDIYIPLANAGNAEAQCRMGYIMKSGFQDYKAAFEWYLKAAKNGHAEAQGKVGNLYRKGKGVEKNSATGISWYKRSAEQGYAEAQCSLGQCYFVGDVNGRVELDEAFKWTRLAAENGHMEGQHNLGTYYLMRTRNVPGEVVHSPTPNDPNFLRIRVFIDPKDIEQGIYWLSKAAAQGAAESQFCLAQIYLQGEIVETDMRLAFQYLRMAAIQGDQRAISQLEINREICDSMGI